MAILRGLTFALVLVWLGGQPAHAQSGLIRDAEIVAALEAGTLGYTEALGLPELRRAIADLYADWYEAEVDPGRIAVTVGASGAFVLVLLAAFDAGQRIGIVEPGYPAYKTMARALDLVPITISTRREHGFQPTPEDVARTLPLDGLILASPANPTGAMLEGEPRDLLLDLCQAARVRVLMDEIYHGLVFAGRQTTLAVGTPGAIVLNSFSKLFGLTGWRVGWLVLPEALVSVVERLAQNLFISPPAFAQRAALAALRHRAAFAERRRNYRANWQLLGQALVDAGVDPGAIVKAEGGFYLYVDLGDFTVDSNAFCQRLLVETGVAATPGIDFDAERGDRFVRFSVAGPPYRVAEAARRLGGWLPAQRRNHLGD